MESDSGDYASLDDTSMGASSRSGGMPAGLPALREESGFSSYVTSLEASGSQLGPNCGSVVEHSPQGRYVRFNFRLEACAYKEVGWRGWADLAGHEWSDRIGSW